MITKKEIVKPAVHGPHTATNGASKSSTKVHLEKPLAETNQGDEAVLLTAATQDVAPTVRRRFRALANMQKQRDLSIDEYEELIKLSDLIEMANALRIEAQAEIARLRGTSLREVHREFTTRKRLGRGGTGAGGSKATA